MVNNKLYIILLIAFVAGCVGQKTVKDTYCPVGPQPILPRINTADDIREYNNSGALRINTLHASGTVSLYQSGRKIFTFPVVIMFARNELFFMRAYKPLAPNLFTCIENNGTFWIQVPSENSIITGKNEALYRDNSYSVSFIPEYLRKALFCDYIGSENEVMMQKNSGTETVKLDVFRAESSLRIHARSIIFDEKTLNAIQETHYSPNGLNLFDVARKDFKYNLTAQVYVPHSITITDIRNLKMILFEFSKVLINEPIDPALFSFYYPQDMYVDQLQ